MTLRIVANATCNVISDSRINPLLIHPREHILKNLSAPVLRVAFLVCCAGASFGLGVASIAGVLHTLTALFTLDLRGEQELVFALVIACFFGAAAAGPLSAKYGRKPAIAGAAVLALLAYLMIGQSPDYFGLILARVLAGLSIGLISMVVPMYAAEVTVAKQRGAVVSLFQLAVTGGILLAYGLSLMWKDSDQWHWVMAAPIVPTILMLLSISMLPESPRWLLRRGQVERAKATVWRLGLDDEWPTLLNSTQTSATQSRVSYASWLRKGRVVGVLVLCSSLFILQNLSGIDGILYYAPHIFQDLGFSQGTAVLTATFGLGLANFFATLVSVMIVDRMGRRPLLIGGSLIMALGLTCVALASTYDWAWLGLVGLAVYIVAFAMSLGPLPYVMMAELFPSAIREQGIAVASAVSWLFNALIAWSFLSLLEAWGLPTVFLSFASVCVASLLISWFWAPETRNASLEDIEDNVLQGQPLRKLGEAQRAAS